MHHAPMAITPLIIRWARTHQATDWSEPQGDDWIQKPKWDGFRFRKHFKDGAGVRFFSRHGAEYTDRLPGMTEACELPTHAAILDGRTG